MVYVDRDGTRQALCDAGGLISICKAGRRRAKFKGLAALALGQGITSP